MEKKEIRHLTLSKSELRADQEKRTIEGYALVFDSESELLWDHFREVIKPEAMTGVLDKSDVLDLVDHAQDRGVLARRYPDGTGTLELKVDEKGLFYRFEVPNTTLGNDLLESLKRGDIKASSFAFVVAQGGQMWEEQEDGTYKRTITQFQELYDVSQVYRPAYPATSAAVRSLEEYRKAAGAGKKKEYYRKRWIENEQLKNESE